jgi:hypothetical protein
MLCLCPAFWHLDTNIHLVFSGFTSRQTSLLASNRAFVCFCRVSMSVTNHFVKWIINKYIWILLEYSERTHHKNGDGTNIFPQSGRRKQNDWLWGHTEGAIRRSPVNRTRDTKRNLEIIPENKSPGHSICKSNRNKSFINLGSAFFWMFPEIKRRPCSTFSLLQQE